MEYQYYNYQVKDRQTGAVVELTVTKEEAEIYAEKISSGCNQYVVEEIPA